MKNDVKGLRSSLQIKIFEQIVVSQRLAVHHFNLIIIYITAVI